MAVRKPWDSLSQPYRNRLARQGITKSGFDSGVSIKAARGHDTAPESARYRKLAATARVDIADTIEDFEDLPAAEQEELARLWIQGITSKARGPIDRKTGRRKPAARQVVAKMDLLDAIAEYGFSESTFWKAFRSSYADSFSAAA